MSKNFKKYQMYYKLGFYSKQMLRMLVGKGIAGITEEEYETITEEDGTEV